MARLKRSECSGPGITRRGRGKGFEYLDDEGRRIEDPEVLERINELVIPPAWKDVWICPYPMGHIQATGIDDAGRKQYLYHPRWREIQDRKKFDSMVRFAQALPAMRKRVERDLKGEGITQKRVLATMKKSHVTIGESHDINFDFTGKSGQRHVRYVVDEPVAEIVEQLKRRRGGGDELLAYRDEGG